MGPASGSLAAVHSGGCGTRPGRAVVAGFFYTLFFFSGWCASGCSGPPAEPLPLKVGIPREPLASLMAIAAGEGFFKSEGLDVTIVDDYPSGKRALDALLDGEIEITAAAEVPIVFRSFERDDFRIVATIGSSDDEPRIVARTDRGVRELSDLRGRPIATQRKSAVHYYLHLILLQQGIPEDDVTFLQAEELVPALAEGKIDAFSMREPYVAQAQELLGDRAVVFATPGLYIKTFNLVTRQDVLQEKRPAVEAFLRALVRAERFAAEEPQAARDVVAVQLQMEPEALQAMWDQIDLRLSLGQELVTGMEDEARWALDGDLVEAERVPNYLEMIDTDCLDNVRPSCVTIVH